ncbi:hypothetical protein CXB51_017502 [Gossypium anomalum]|uniref:Uncharacterized protein n=1 Tax=Gossypium anomalum TaxID=47600 RepID=A0A8J5YH37_9ROSI|nr:hypothetical protein CXB51_017502 [Gossypium anomalum]
MARAFWGTRVMEIVKKHNSGDLAWKRIKLSSTRKANAKKRLHCVWQVLTPFSFFLMPKPFFFLGFCLAACCFMLSIDSLHCWEASIKHAQGSFRDFNFIWYNLLLV